MSRLRAGGGWVAGRTGRPVRGGGAGDYRPPPARVRASRFGRRASTEISTRLGGRADGRAGGRAGGKVGGRRAGQAGLGTAGGRDRAPLAGVNDRVTGHASALAAAVKPRGASAAAAAGRRGAGAPTGAVAAAGRTLDRARGPDRDLGDRHLAPGRATAVTGRGVRSATAGGASARGKEWDYRRRWAGSMRAVRRRAIACD